MANIKKNTVCCVIFLAIFVIFSQVEAVNECYSDSGCSRKLFRPYCCEKKSIFEDNVCRSECVGLSCDKNSDCAPNECCGSDDKCRKGHCLDGLAGWIVAVIVISVIVVIVIPIAVIVFCCCCAAAASTRPARRGVVIAQPGTTGATVVLTQQQQQQQQYPTQQGQPMHQPYPDQPPSYYHPGGNPYPPAAK